jgi:hypothetical protein
MAKSQKQNRLTGAETYKLCQLIETMTAEPDRTPWDNWEAAEAYFGKELNRRVTRFNITAAAASVSVAVDCLVVITGERSLAKRATLLDERVTTLEKAGEATDSTLAGGLDLLGARLDGIDNLLAIAASRIDTSESNREAVRAMMTRHQTEIGHLNDQVKQLAGQVQILEVFFDKLMADDGPIAELELANGKL